MEKKAYDKWYAAYRTPLYFVWRTMVSLCLDNMLTDLDKTKRRIMLILATFSNYFWKTISITEQNPQVLNSYRLVYILIQTYSKLGLKSIIGIFFRLVEFKYTKRHRKNHLPLLLEVFSARQNLKLSSTEARL